MFDNDGGSVHVSESKPSRARAATVSPIPDLALPDWSVTDWSVYTDRSVYTLGAALRSATTFCAAGRSPMNFV